MRALGYEAVQWDVDTIDWKKERSAAAILETVLPRLAPGSIILCHNNGYQIEEYLPTLIEQAQEAGYEFVTVDELLLDGATTIDANGPPAAGLLRPRVSARAAVALRLVKGRARCSII